MEPPEPHGGDAGHASTPSGGDVASQLTAALGVPDTPTPSQWILPGPLGAVIGRDSEGQSPQTLNEALGTAAGPEERSLGAQGKNRGVIKPLQHGPPRPLGIRDPLKDFSRQLQSLSGDMERAIEQQAIAQQQAQQGGLEALWTQVNETITGLKAELQLRDELY